MTTKEIIELIEKGEDSRTQFKEKFNSINSLAAEITAFLNSDGGQILIGVTDDGDIKGLSQKEVKKLNQWISSTCRDKIEPPVTRISTYNMKVDEKIIMIIEIPEGVNKFYVANNNDVWVKVGADKRKASREELKRLLQESRNIYADEMPIEETSIDDLDLWLFRRFYKKRTNEDFNENEQNLKQILTSLKLMKDNKLTLAGVLLFGKYPDEIVPTFNIKGVFFKGNSRAELNYRDSQDFFGTIGELFKQGRNFISSHLTHLQKNQSFNSTGISEIPQIALEEALINALLHRNYFLASNIRLFIFNNRLEIISPGTLPNTATIEGIKLGLHVERNPIIVSIVRDLEGIPYRGIGTGILRIINECKKEGVKVDFIEEKKTQEFKVIFHRQGN